MDWHGLPEVFRASYDAAAEACVAGEEDLADLNAVLGAFGTTCE